MSKVSTQVRNMSSVSREVTYAATAQLDLLAQGLVAECAQVGVPPPPEPEAMFRTLARLLEVREARMVAADLELAAESADSAAARATRDEKVQGLLGATLEARALVETHMGTEVAQQYGFSGTTPRTPDALVHFARNVAYQMTRSPRVVAVPGIGTLDTSYLVGRLEAALQAAVEAIGTVSREARESHDALGNRDAAVAEWRRTYQAVADILSASFALVGRHDLADRVRPTARRASGEVAAAPQPQAPATPAPEPADA